ITMTHRIGDLLLKPSTSCGAEVTTPCGSTLFETTPPRTSWPLLSSFLNRHLKESLYFAETLLVCDFNVYYHAIFRIYICPHLICFDAARTRGIEYLIVHFPFYCCAFRRPIAHVAWFLTR